MATITFVNKCGKGDHLTFDVTMESGNVYRKTYHISELQEPITFTDAELVLLTNVKMRLHLANAVTPDEIITALDGASLQEAFEVID